MQNVPRRLRVIGASVLVIGALAAGLVYWLGSRNGDMSDDLSMQGFSRAEQRQMGQLYGKSGLLIDQLEDDLKQPGTRQSSLWQPRYWWRPAASISPV